MHRRLRLGAIGELVASSVAYRAHRAENRLVIGLGNTNAAFHVTGDVDDRSGTA